MDNSRINQGSHQVNSVGNDGEKIILAVGELAEIKEVVGRLYKKITELEIAQKQDRDKDRAELAAWAQTNLIQIQLLDKQTGVIEMLTVELKRSERLSQQSERLSESLLSELQHSNSLLANMPKSSPNVENLELKGLKAEVVALKEALRGIPQQLERIERGQKTLEARQSKMEEEEESALFSDDLQNNISPNPSRGEGWDSKDWLRFAGKVGVLVSFATGVWMIVERTKTIESAALQTWQQTGWSNTKLERIEKYLGIKKRK
jgi:hypothetical protein